MDNTKFNFDRVGYCSNINQCSVQYAGGAKNKPSDFSFSKLMDMDAMQQYLDDANQKLTEQMHEKFEKVVDARYTITPVDDMYYSGIDVRFNMMVKGVASKEDLGKYEAYLGDYQKRFAKDFNKQPFTQTEYGFAKFPRTNGPFGVHLNHDEDSTGKLRISELGKDGGNCNEIIAFPVFTGNCGYYFLYNDWPKAPNEWKGHELGVGKMEVKDNGIFLETAALTDETVYKIAEKLGDYGKEAAGTDVDVEKLSDIVAGCIREGQKAEMPELNESLLSESGPLPEEQMSF